MPDAYEGSIEHRALVVFARAPHEGRVKTRLAATLGNAAALAIYRDLVAQTLAAARESTHYRTTVAFAPASAEREMAAWLGDDVTLRPQHEGELGERMAHAIADEITRGASRVVIVGTDCPDVTAAVIDEAFAQLETTDIVLGPASDGGYYLIGMSRPHDELFRDVPWSDPRTLAVTLDRARAAGLEVALLATLHDIDTAEDWRAWLARAGSAGAGDRGVT